MSSRDSTSGHPSRHPSIAVVGAGIGGLTLAACLLRMGVRMTISEQAPAFSRVGAGIQMCPNAMRILARLALRERLEPLAFSPPCPLSSRPNSPKTWSIRVKVQS